MDTTPPTHSERREALQTVAEMALNFLPGVGGPVAVAFKHRMNVTLQRRQEAWLAELATGLEDLRGRFEGFDPDSLVNDDVFVDAVMTASRMAARNSQREKLDALRNAVLNAALPGSPDEDEQQGFFALIDDLTATHLRLLTLLEDPREFFVKLGQPKPHVVATSPRIDLIERTLPDLAVKGHGAVDRHYSDLQSRHLVFGVSGGWAPKEGPGHVDVTAYGTAFLAFIRDPRTNDAD